MDLLLLAVVVPQGYLGVVPAWVAGPVHAEVVAFLVGDVEGFGVVVELGLALVVDVELVPAFDALVAVGDDLAVEVPGLICTVIVLVVDIVILPLEPEGLLLVELEIVPLVVGGVLLALQPEGYLGVVPAGGLVVPVGLEIETIVPGDVEGLGKVVDLGPVIIVDVELVPALLALLPVGGDVALDVPGVGDVVLVGILDPVVLPFEPDGRPAFITEAEPMVLVVEELGIVLQGDLHSVGAVLLNGVVPFEVLPVGGVDVETVAVGLTGFVVVDREVQVAVDPILALGGDGAIEEYGILVAILIGVLGPVGLPVEPDRGVVAIVAKAVVMPLVVNDVVIVVDGHVQVVPALDPAAPGGHGPVPVEVMIVIIVDREVKGVVIDVGHVLVVDLESQIAAGLIHVGLEIALETQHGVPLAIVLPLFHVGVLPSEPDIMAVTLVVEIDGRTDHEGAVLDELLHGVVEPEVEVVAAERQVAQDVVGGPLVLEVGIA